MGDRARHESGNEQGELNSVIAKYFEKPQKEAMSTVCPNNSGRHAKPKKLDYSGDGGDY